MSSPKRRLEDFAAVGGAPLFAEPRHVGRPSFGHKAEILSLIEGALDRRWVTNNGPLVQELEASIGVRLGVREVVTTSNGTVALELLARALDLRGEVIVPAYTFVATAHAFRWLGIQPVFCDVNPETHLIDVKHAESLITERTSAVVGVHLWGEICDVGALEQLCARRNLKLLFDAAHAFGCGDNTRAVGNFGSAEAFSFHGTKFFHTFEGGAVVTNDSILAGKLRQLRNFGFAGVDSVVALGSNARLSEVAAAAGIVNLRHLDDAIQLNREKQDRYLAGTEGIAGLRLYPANRSEPRNFQYVVTEIDEVGFGLSRDQVLGLLQAEGVLGRRYFFPGVHRMEPYHTEQPDLDLPHTQDLCRRVLVLPASSAVDLADIDTITQLIRDVARFAPGLRAALQSERG